MGPIYLRELHMIRVTRMVWSGALAVGLGVAVMGCSGATEKAPAVPKTQQDKAVNEMRDKQGGKPAEKTEKAPAEKGETPAEKGEVQKGQKASKTEKKGAD
jgi:hypothetical protein